MAQSSIFKASRVGQFFEALKPINLCPLSLAPRRSLMFRTYLSLRLRKYDDFVGNGLPGKDPISGIRQDTAEVLSVPLRYQPGGGTDSQEMLPLAALAKLVPPSVCSRSKRITAKSRQYCRL